MVQRRDFGALGDVSVLSLGGGGIGSVYGPVDRAQGVATVHAAIDAGITLLDLAPSYGPGELSPEADLVVHDAFGGAVPEEITLSSKVSLNGGDEPAALRATIRRELQGTLRRLGRDHVDLLFLHSYVAPPASQPRAETVTIDEVREVVRPEFEALRAEGLIRAWGLTGTAYPDELCTLMIEEPRPTAVQCVVNPLDSVGNIWPTGPGAPPDNGRVRRVASEAGVAVMAIRVLAAGALAGQLDRSLPASDPAARDARRAAPFRNIADQMGSTPAVLAYRYALTLTDVATVVIGVKTPTELEDCLRAEAEGPLSAAQLSEIDTLMEGVTS